MRYSTNGNRYSSNFLRNIGRIAYATMRQDPVAAAGMERGKTVRTYVDDDIDVVVRIDQKSDSPDVHIVERDMDLVEVVLPKTKHWAEQYGVVLPPPWLKLVINSDMLEHSFNELAKIHASHFTLKQLAVVLGGDIRDLSGKIIAATSEPKSFADELLAASVEMSDVDPDNWDVDIRGLALAMVVERLQTEASTEVSQVDADTAEEDSST